jgi:hypothetical protein
MPCTLGKRISEMSRWIHLSEKDISNSISFLFAAIPLCYNGRNMFFLPRNGKRLATHQDQYHRFASSINRLNQITLCASQT